MPKRDRAMANFTIWGIIGSDPILTHSKEGKPICQLSIAFHPYPKNHPKNVVIWIKTVSFGELAMYIANNYVKGDWINILKATPCGDQWLCKNCKNKIPTLKFIIWEIGSEKTTGEEEDIPWAGEGAADDAGQDYGADVPF